MFSSSVSASTTTTSYPATSHSQSQSLFETFEQYIAQSQFAEAQGKLFVLFRHTQSEDEIQQCYQFLFELLPHWTSLGVLENNLQTLLAKSVSFVKEQEQLALFLARRYLQERELKKAMLCFAKALQMNRSEENYLAAFEVFLHYFQVHKEEQLNGFLINPIPSPDTIVLHLKTIETLKTFGIPKDELLPFFEKIHDRISHVPSEKHADYLAPEQAALDLCNSSWEPQKTAVERYWEPLEIFRACFTGQDTRKVQKEAFHAMKKLIALFIEDICILIGLPPCHYDLRAMGSLGREEMCPYSDLECLLLIEDKRHQAYFARMLDLLELQMASLGETQGLPFVFTCLSNRSGLHLDNSPLQEKRLMQTPKQMAQLHQTKTYAGNDIECTVLKTTSLYQTTSQLYLDYQEHVQRIRKEFPFPFFDLCRGRSRDFSLAWKQHF
ncbi:MAG: DUF294 nucleotidyltransferase-like domain-containing protein, partial [Parachlamydiaceae bacterium]